MDQAALQQEMDSLNAQGLHLKQSILAAQETEKIASEKAKESEKDYEDSSFEDKEALEKAQEEADKKLTKATITHEKASAKLKAAKDEVQFLPLRTASFEKRNILFALMEQDRKDATDAIKKLTELERQYLMTQHRYQELRDELSIVKGTDNINM